jgi:hypothetical protein
MSDDASEAAAVRSQLLSLHLEEPGCASASLAGLLAEQQQRSLGAQVAEGLLALLFAILGLSLTGLGVWAIFSGSPTGGLVGIYLAGGGIAFLAAFFGPRRR